MVQEQIKEINLDTLDAFIFDMDGVITHTANVHAEAWKKMFDEFLKTYSKREGIEYKPFSLNYDYPHFLDGKPRYDGVRSLLESRGITLPYGNIDDGPDKETIFGLGNRKNDYFLIELRKKGAEPYRSSIKFIKKLKQKGLRTAVISSSRNCAEVLQAAGVENLFDERVDGVDLAEMGIKGKPDPSIFKEAAKRLGVNQSRTAVVEDALAGVQAGKSGRFAIVIGVDRANQSEELIKNGADVVISNLSELSVNQNKIKIKSNGRRHWTTNLPSALSHIDEIFRTLDKGMLAVFLDYDGTLTPIVDDPKNATLPAETKAILRHLAEFVSVAIVSGRDLSDVKHMVGLNEIIYAGSHGFDIAGPEGTSHEEVGQDYLPALDRAEERLIQLTSNIQGARIERKRFAIAIHFRQMDDSLIDDLESHVDAVVLQEPGLKKSQGKKIFELSPNMEWDKGKAIQLLLRLLFVDTSDAVPIYIGDDTTDEDAFRALQGHGITIVVSDEERMSEAEYSLKNTDEVREFLNKLSSYTEKEATINTWVLHYDGYDPDTERLRETLCTLGNGFFATRGAAPESSASHAHYPGTYIANHFNRLKTDIAGEMLENESMVNAPNWLPLTFRINDGPWFDPDQSRILDYHQKLDLRIGVLHRFIRFEDAKGRKTIVNQRRIVSLYDPHLAGLETVIIAENWSGRLKIRSSLNGTITNSGVARYHQLNSSHLKPIEQKSLSDEVIALKVQTNQSHIYIAEAARTRIFLNGEHIMLKPEVNQEEGYIEQEFQLDVQEEDEVIVDKMVSLYTSKDSAISECGLAAQKKIVCAGEFESSLQQHSLSWNRLWKRCHIAIKDGNRTIMTLHLHILHLLQSLSVNTIDLDAGVPPRGLHGEAYRGHIMWDELFVFPFFNLRIPDITRSLLMYRYRRLPEARWAAQQAGYQGAMYPWQSGSNGREESQILHLNPESGRWVPDNSWLQRHVNHAIAYNVWLYYQSTNDIDFLTFYGAEIIFEIARFWSSKAEYNRYKDRYEIRKIMGPDEFHDSYPDSDEPGINNNAYTNIMAVWVLCKALEILELLPPDRRQDLRDRIGLNEEEVVRWDDISRKMLVPFHEQGIISQFEGYDQLNEFDWKGYRKKYGDIHRLDRILEAEGDTPNRYKVSKQADVLMLFYLLSSDELRELFSRLSYEFEYKTIPKNIQYYLDRTSHGSTLSRLVHSWVLARSKRELSWHLFKDALESDVSDIQGGTTTEGIHLGAMAGTVDIIQRCYTGIETRGDTLWLNPYLPNKLKELKFTIQYRGHVLDLMFTHKEVTVTACRRDVNPMNLGFRDKVVQLEQGQTKKFKL